MTEGELLLIYCLTVITSFIPFFLIAFKVVSWLMLWNSNAVSFDNGANVLYEVLAILPICCFTFGGREKTKFSFVS